MGLRIAACHKSILKIIAHKEAGMKLKLKTKILFPDLLAVEARGAKPSARVCANCGIAAQYKNPGK
jgi:hypothetical protein